MKKILFPSVLITLLLLVGSCHTSDKVATNNLLQKRKYNKGYHSSIRLSKPKQNLTFVKESFAPSEDVPLVEDYSSNTTSPVTSGYETASIPLTYHISPHIDPNSLIASTADIIVQNPLIIFKDHNEKVKSENSEQSEAAPTGGSSQLVALLLCLFIGSLGIHRFYLGYIGIGIIQLLTFGCCGLWTLIDLIMIITGSLKPNGGEYTDTF